MKKQLSDQQVLVCDGAMGTMIQGSGLPSDQAPEWWNLESPDTIGRIHEAYVEAGAHLVETNTFGGSPLKLREYGLEDQSFAICRAGASLARDAVGDRALVAGSVGPTGALIEPMGTVTFEEMLDAFSVQIAGLADGGADLILIETMSELMEVKAALLAAHSKAPELPVICQMTFEENQMTVMGTSPETAAVVLDRWGADMIGVNCSTGPAGLLPVIERMSLVTNKPLTVQPNAGLPVIEGGQVSYRETPEQMAAYVSRFADLGVKIVGGCCGTTPEHIAVIRREADRCRYHVPVLPAVTVFSSRRQTVFPFDGDLLATALSGAGTEELRPLIKWIREQIRAGCRLLLVDLPGKEPSFYKELLLGLKGALDVPLLFPADLGKGLDTALRYCTGVATLINLSLESSVELWTVARESGANVVLNATKQVADRPLEERQDELDAAIEKALEMGIGQERILTDAFRSGDRLNVPKDAAELAQSFARKGYVQVCPEASAADWASPESGRLLLRREP